MKNYCGIVSIIGGLGLGKNTVAFEVLHDLTSDPDIVVIFSSLSNASTVPKIRQRLGHVVGVNPGVDSESALVLWL